MNLDTSRGHQAMDYREHSSTYRGFIRGFVWMASVVVAILVLMAITLL
jgi:tetrahydromethanopterin S-methyltransferase subunit F